MDQRIKHAYDYIKRNFQARIKLEDIASHVHVSPFHLQRLFKAEMGESPHECLHRMRLEKAAHLMKINPIKSMTEIALDCGFTSLASFSRAFKQTYERSPSAFRAAPDLQIVEPGEIAELPPLEVQVEHFPGSWILYRHTSIYDPQVWAEFDIAQANAVEKGLLPPAAKRLGAFTHIPFHDKHTYLNYFAGVQIQHANPAQYAHTFCIPAGRYATFETAVPYPQLTALLLQFKSEWLDLQPYYIRAIFMFEEMLEQAPLKPEAGVRRKLYVPVMLGE